MEAMPIQGELRRIEKKLAGSRIPLSLSLKLKMAELILRTRERRKGFGMFVILGWQHKWQRYIDTPDLSQDIFQKRRVNILEIKGGERRSPHGRRSKRGNGSIASTVNFDGAILIDKKGNVLHSGAMIEGLRPRATLKALRASTRGDLSTQFGFKQKVHMRHIAAITSSYMFKGSTVFTVSEETDHFHIMEGGRIIYSTVRGE